MLSPDDRTELIEGDIIDMPPIGSRHAAIVTVLGKRLVQAVGDTVDVRVQAPLRLAPRSEPQPDIALVKSSPAAYRSAHPVAGDVLLLIEVSDATVRYDLEVKARLYATHGIPEYWVIDLPENRVCRHRRPSGERYTERDEMRTGAIRLPSLTNEILISDLF